MLFGNGESRKQIVAKSKWALFQSRNKWNNDTRDRIEILFSLYLDIKEGYEIVDKMRQIMNKKIDKVVARTQLAQWYEQMERFNNKAFNTVGETFRSHYDTILNTSITY